MPIDLFSLRALRNGRPNKKNIRKHIKFLEKQEGHISHYLGMLNTVYLGISLFVFILGSILILVLESCSKVCLLCLMRHSPYWVCNCLVKVIMSESDSLFRCYLFFPLLHSLNKDILLYYLSSLVTSISKNRQ